MSRIWPWIRTVISLPLGLVAISLVHELAKLGLPQLYANDLANDADRTLMLLLSILAGIVGSFLVGAIARHRLRLHMGLFLVAMLIIDWLGIIGYLAAQPLWFKIAIIVTLPLQVWVGGKLARMMFPSAYSTE